MSRRIPVAATAALVLALTACNSGGDPEPPAATEPPVTEETSAEEPTQEEPSPTEDATDQAGEQPTEAGTSGPEDDPAADLPEFGTEVVSSGAFPGSGGDLLHSTVRIGEHEGFDRVVFDFIGSDTPEFQVQYVEDPTQQGSGRTVDLDGEAVLEVVVTNTRYPEEGEEYPGGPGTYNPDQVQVVEQVRLDGTFEGHTQGFIGVGSEAPFRAFTLADPVRVVVDVQHP